MTVFQEEVRDNNSNISNNGTIKYNSQTTSTNASNNIEEKESQDNNKSMKELYPTLLVLFTYLFVIAYCIPIFPTIILQSCNQNKSLAAKYNGYSFVGKGLLQLLISPIIGAVSDKYGRKYFLIGCLCSLCLQIWILVLFYNNDDDQGSISLDIVMCVRVFAGTSDAILTIVYAAITDITTTSSKHVNENEIRIESDNNNDNNGGGSGVRKKDLSSNFGTVGAIFGISFIIGPATGGFVTTFILNNNIRQSLMIVGAIATIMTMHTIVLYKEPLDEHDRLQYIQYTRFNPIEPLRVVYTSDALRSLCIPYLLYEISFHVNTAWILWLQYRFSWEILDVGCYLSALGISIAFFQAYVLRIYIPKYINERKAIIYGYISCSMYYFLSGIMPHGYMLYLLLLFVGYGSLAGPCLRSTLSSHISNYDQGLLQGALDSITTIASIIAGYIFNIVLSWSQYQNDNNYQHIYFYNLLSNGAINFLASLVLLPAIYFISKALKLYALKDDLLSDPLVTNQNKNDDIIDSYGDNDNNGDDKDTSFHINEMNYT